MKAILALSLFIATAIGAEVRQFGPLQPISVDRTGIVGQNLGSWLHADNGQALLFLWRDDRHRFPENGNSNGSGTLAIRLGHDGAPLDPFPVFLPFDAGAVVWRGQDWLVLGTGWSAIISAEGEILERREHPELDDVLRAVWTGSVDDGTNITISAQPTDFTYHDADDRYETHPIGVIDAGRMAVLYLARPTARPYSNARRLFVAAEVPPRARAVRH